MNGQECPSRLGDGAVWCDTHGHVTAKCLVCDTAVRIAQWDGPITDQSVWLIGAHDVA